MLRCLLEEKSSCLVTLVYLDFVKQTFKDITYILILFSYEANKIITTRLKRKAINNFLPSTCCIGLVLNTLVCKYCTSSIFVFSS